MTSYTYDRLQSKLRRQPKMPQPRHRKLLDQQQRVSQMPQVARLKSLATMAETSSQTFGTALRRPQRMRIGRPKR
jgi:hypothetical protein